MIYATSQITYESLGAPSNGRHPRTTAPLRTPRTAAAAPIRRTLAAHFGTLFGTTFQGVAP